MRRIHDLLDRWVKADPQRLAIIDHDRRNIDFAGFRKALDEAVACLTAHGVRGGDRVLVAAENSLALLAFLFAASRLDAWAIPINARMSAEEIDRIVSHATPRALVFTQAASRSAASHAERWQAVESDPATFGTVMLAGPLEADPEPVHAAAEDQVIALIYTTGTTGNPKGVMLTHGNLLYASDASMQVRALNAADHVVGVLPITHIFALSSAFLAAVRAGALIELLPRFDPAAVFSALKAGASAMPAVPAMYPLLFNYAEETGIAQPDAPRLRYLSSGGAPMDPDWKRRVEAFFGVTLHNGYGMTEASPGIATTRVGMERDDISCGPVLPGQEVVIAPPSGADAPADGVGEILVRGPNVMKGYYRNPEETARTIDTDGFLHTGDLGRFSEDGSLFVVGRSKELIIRSGFNVYPPEVEAALNRHPAVTQAAIIGRPVADGNEEVLAFVQRVPGADIDEAALKTYLHDRLAPYKRPARIVVADDLPTASTGKVLKHRLIETFAGEL
ncbi:MAG: AMP-binding protein [Pseudomonadota bacterium]